MDGDRNREIEEKLHECVERKPMDVVIATTGVIVPDWAEFSPNTYPMSEAKSC